MNFKNLFKFTLSALLLSGSTSAFAQGETTESVTLGNGTTMSWSQFVNDLKNPPTSATGVVPDDAQVRINLQNEKDTLQTAEATLKEKQDALPDLKTTLNNAKTALANDSTTLNTAKENLETATAKLVDAAQKKLDDAKASVAANEETIGTLDSQIAGYETSKSTAEQRIQTLQDQLRTLNASPSLQKKTDNVTDTLPSLKAAYKLATEFSKGYNATSAASRPETPEIYYYKDINEEDEETTLYLSFSSTKPTVEGNWQPVTPKTFRSTLTVSSAGDVTYVSLYMGPEFAAKNGNDAYYTVDTYQGNKSYIVQLAVATLKDLCKEPNFTTTTTVVTDEYLDDAAAQVTLASIRNVENEITTLTNQINGLHKDENGQDLPEKDQIDGYVELIEKAEAEKTKLENENTTIEATYETLEQAVTDAPNDASLEQYKTAVTNAQTDVDEAQDEVDTAQANYNAAAEAVETAQTAVDNAKKDVETAQAALNAAQAAANDTALKDLLDGYQSITLTGDINATEAVGKNYSGEIYAEGHIINIPSGIDLFNTFSGVLDNAAINGSFAKNSTSGTFSDVAVWTGTGSTPGRYYDDEGTRTTYTTLSTLGYAARDYFGIDFAANALASRSDETIVHKIKVYDPARPNTIPDNSYVIINNDKFFTGATTSITLGANVFVEAMNTLTTKIPNVIYPDAAGNIMCDNVMITDREAFFCPKEIKAKNVTYNRTFTKGSNTVCLPFPVSADLNENISYVCTYDSEEDNYFWFTSASGEIEANTPMLLVANNDFELNLEDITIPVSATPSDQKVKGKETDGSTSYGTFKFCSRNEILGAANGEKVYGLSGDKFQPATASANFPSFRMVICSATKASATGNAPRRIGIRDEQGKEINIDGIVTGIDEVEATAAALDIRGGHGEIIITSETELGQVEVYALDGRLAAVANVVEGTTSVNVANGLYIVMGKKVVVK